MATRKGSAHANGSSRPRSFRLFLALIYLAALSLLIVWEYHERLEVFSSECDLRDQAKSGLYDKAYSRFLDWTRPDTASQVVTLAITADLEDVQNNVCLGRAYLADVLHVLSKSRPGVVVIDKFYGPNACAIDPASTHDLKDAVRSIPAPVVIGESTNGLKEAVASACLAHKPQLNFDAPNVTHGITRLNAEAERLPLRWLVLPDTLEKEGAPAKATPAFADSLSLAAVRAYDAEFSSRTSIQRLIQQDSHAYADVDMELPRITSTQLLCSANDESLRTRWHLTCTAKPELQKLLGKVVLIGNETPADQWNVLGHEMWGFELQARYIQALLSGDYLRSLPIVVSIVLFAAFVFLIEGAPILMLGYLPHWKKKPILRFAYPRRRYVWVLLCAAAVIVVSSVLSLGLRYLPPLLVYGDILFVMMTRLMYFSAEEAEHPFLHAHHPRKAHPMSELSHIHTTTPATSSQPNVDETSTEVFDADNPSPLASPVAASSNRPGGEGGSVG